MEKLPLLVHGKPITDHGGEDNVGVEQRLQMTDDEILQNARDIAQDYRQSVPATDPAFWMVPTLNIERMPRFNYRREDSTVIDFYSEYLATASMKPVEDDDAAA
ncbi:hypothetical protein ACC806_03640 [Rhizobium ruizarguesonis]